MNEEELKRRDVEEIKARGKIYRKGLKEGFQKGKLEERERILNYINKLLNECRRNNPLSDYWAGKEIGLEQLQKEIGEEKQDD